MQDLLLLRNFHDLGGAYIPLVFCQLRAEQLKMAMEYWVWLSKKGNMTHPDREQKCRSDSSTHFRRTISNSLLSYGCR